MGRVKIPVLSIIVDRDKEIENFRKTVSYRLEMDNGAISEQVYETREDAEKALADSIGTNANVQSAVSENKSKNRPLLHSLTTLQQEANRVYGYTAKEVLEAAQSYIADGYAITASGNTNYPYKVAVAHICNGVTYSNRLDSTFKGGTLASGNYYLTENLTLTSEIRIDRNSIVKKS